MKRNRKNLRNQYEKALSRGYYSCNMINSCFLNFNGRIDIDAQCVTICCEPIGDRPSMPIFASGKETIDTFMQLRSGVISEGHPQTGERVYTTGCTKCANWQRADWKNDGLIHYVNLSMYPAPCQCKCIYCGIHEKNNGLYERSSMAEVSEHYDKMFDAIDYALGKGIIAHDARWQVSSGEITIHPYKDKILSCSRESPPHFTQTVSYLMNESLQIWQQIHIPQLIFLSTPERPIHGIR